MVDRWQTSRLFNLSGVLSFFISPEDSFPRLLDHRLDCVQTRVAGRSILFTAARCTCERELSCRHGLFVHSGWQAGPFSIVYSRATVNPAWANLFSDLPQGPVVMRLLCACLRWLPWATIVQLQEVMCRYDSDPLLFSL